MPTSYDYNLNRPAPANKPSNDVRPMQVNTNSINSLISTDHVTFGTAASYTGNVTDGFHTTVHLVNQPDPSAPVTNVMEVYQKFRDDGISTKPQLFLQSGNFIPYAMTRNFVPAISGQNGASFLPGGFIIQWGTILAIQAGSPVTFTQNFKTGTVPIITTGNLTSSVNASVGRIESATNLGFTVFSFNNLSTTCNWIAIGQ